jgi:hypothetical protein
MVLRAEVDSLKEKVTQVIAGYRFRIRIDK